MWRRVTLVKTDDSKERIAPIIRVKWISKLGTTLASQLLVTANIVLSSLILFTLMIEAKSSSETSVVSRATLRHIPEDGIPRSHRSEILVLEICEADSVFRSRQLLATREKFPKCYRSQSSVTVSIRVPHRPLSWVRSIQTIIPIPFFLDSF
jgi:hypothetical protein